MMSPSKIGLPLILTAVALTGCSAPHSTPQTAYPVARTTEPITIDGRLDEPVWQTDQVIHTPKLFRPLNGEHLTLPDTTARLAYDDEFLYLAVTCQDHDIWSFSDNADSPLWSGDVAELFLKPSSDDPRYYEFVIAPNGTLYDARYPSRGSGGSTRFKRWDSQARIASVIDGTDGNWQDTDRGYTLEVAIPLSALAEAGPPEPGSIWTFGLFRYDYDRTHEAPLLMGSVPVETHGFHNYEQYQPLIFLPPPGSFPRAAGSPPESSQQ